MFQSLANLWFVPQLPDFIAANPDQRVIVQTIPEHVALAGSDIDAAIVYARDRPDGPLVDHMLDEVMVPVCAPGYLAAQGPIPDAAALMGKRLISSATYVDEWRVWADAMGLTVPPPRPHLFFDNRANVLKAASEGLGIALDRRPFGSLQRARGLLVCPLDAARPTGWSYWLVRSNQSRRSRGLRKMRRWLLSLGQQAG